MALTTEDAHVSVPRRGLQAARNEAQEALEIVLGSLADSKAEDVVSIDVTGKTAMADHIVVASGRSQRHVGAISDHLIRDLKSGHVRGVRVEGLTHGDWVLIDAGDVIVHIFRPEVRDFYNIEKMWSAETAGAIHLVS
jgi:ribosome-associated protein